MALKNGHGRRAKSSLSEIDANRRRRRSNAYSSVPPLELKTPVSNNEYAQGI